MKIIKNIFCIIGIFTVLFLGWVFFSNPNDEIDADDMYYDEEFEEDYVEPYQLL